jgi:hypothetical protein
MSLVSTTNIVWRSDSTSAKDKAARASRVCGLTAARSRQPEVRCKAPAVAGENLLLSVGELVFKAVARAEAAQVQSQP